MLVTPLQERMEEWKKVVIQLDKDHSRGEIILQLIKDHSRGKIVQLIWKAAKVRSLTR